MLRLGFCCCPEPASELPQRIEAPCPVDAAAAMPSLLQGGLNWKDSTKKHVPKVDNIDQTPSALVATLGEENVAKIELEVERRLSRSLSRKQGGAPPEQFENVLLEVQRNSTRTLTWRTIQSAADGKIKDGAPEETPEDSLEDLPPPSRHTTRKMTQLVSYEATGTTTSSQISQVENTTEAKMDEGKEVCRESSLKTEHMYIEKLRLQSVISKFSLLAVKGRPCVHIHETTGRRVSARYKLDKALNKFTISHNGIFAWKAVCAVGAVQDVEIVENCVDPFPPQVLSSLESEEEKDQLVRIIYKDSVGRLSSFCLLENSHEARNMFVESLLILRMI